MSDLTPQQWLIHCFYLPYIWIHYFGVKSCRIIEIHVLHSGLKSSEELQSFLSLFSSVAALAAAQQKTGGRNVGYVGSGVT